MFENAVALDPNFALAHAAIANVCAQTHYNYGRDPIWLKRAEAASQRAVRLQPQLPEVLVAQAWILYAAQNYEDASSAYSKPSTANAIARGLTTCCVARCLRRAASGNGKYRRQSTGCEW